jgi:integral membrane protein (TIGR01906 family)
VGKVLPQIIRWLIILAMPVFLVLTSARLLVADWYPRYEYAKASFPMDPYGFTQEQRTQLAIVAIHYLNSPQPAQQAIHMLTEQTMPTDNRPLYQQSEISHMVDVKIVMDQLWRVQVVAGLVVLAGLVILLIPASTRIVGFNALLGGGLLTAILLVVMGLFVVLSFNTFFVQFHEVFFPEGNWTFDWSDSLIRLFPQKFWFDAGTLIVVATLFEGLIAAAVGWALARR